MKKFLALALALAMTLSLAACGGKTDDSASDEEASGTNEPAETPEKPAEPITISISHSYTELDQVSVELNTAKKKAVSFTGSPFTLTSLESLSSSRSPIFIVLPFSAMDPSAVYLLIWDLTLAISSSGLNGFVI